jgi:integrase
MKSLTPRFYLDNSKLSETFVMAAVTCKDGRLKYSTQLKISPADWPEDNDPKNLPDGPLKEVIKKIQLEIKTLSVVYRAMPDTFTKDRIKARLDRIFGRASKAPKRVISGSFESVTNDIISQMYSGEIRNPKTGTAYAKNSVTSMKTTRDVLLQFQKAKGISVDFSSTTEATFKDFVKYLNENDYRLSTINNHVSYWKILAKNAKITFKVPVSGYFEDKSFTIATAKIEGKIALNREDIKKLMNIKLSGADETIRDRFVVNCENGLRISDMSRVTSDHFNGGKLNIITQKKGKEIAQPIGKYTQSILKKYGGELPPKHFTTYINKRIKVIAERAGIDDVVIFKEVIGGVSIQQTKKKFQLISNHTARRTAATNMSLNQIQDSDIDNLLAMSINTYMRYKKEKPVDTADKVKNNSYWK